MFTENIKAQRTIRARQGCDFTLIRRVGSPVKASFDVADGRQHPSSKAKCFF
jgi:hypothetical protein